MKLFGHIAAVAGALLLTVGLPVLRSDTVRTKLRGTDAVSSASVIPPQPEGEYLVLINRDLHTDAEYDLKGLHGEELKAAITEGVNNKPLCHKLSSVKSESRRAMNEIGG